jgi:plastin-1
VPLRLQDEGIRTSHFLLNLLTAVEPRSVNRDVITAGATPEEAALNAKYVLSVARKIGCLVFCTWEDITEVKPKMMMTLVASIMQVAQKLAGAGAGAGGK